MATKEWMLQNLKMYFPWIINEAESVEIYDDLDLLITTRSGGRYLYDDFDKTIQQLKEERDEVDWKRQFGIRLRKLMRRRGIIQSELSEMIGVSVTSLSSYMNGRSVPSIYVAEKMAEALGCSVNDLLHFPK